MPSPYIHLSFSNYNVLKPRDPALEGKITKNDLNCAVSGPNALIGSRFTADGADNPSDAKGASFKINATAALEAGLSPYFTLVSFYVKALDAPPGNITITVKGYSHGSDEILNWHMEVPSGYHIPFLVRIQEYSGKSWDHLDGVEILADYGEDALDWEFCMDDLELQFTTVSGQQLEDQQTHERASELEL